MIAFPFILLKPAEKRKPQAVFIDSVGLFSPNEVGYRVLWKAYD